MTDTHQRIEARFERAGGLGPQKQKHGLGCGERMKASGELRRFATAKKTGTVLSVTVAVLLSVCTQTHAQGQRWSLSPLAPFPCGAVNFDGNSVVFERTLVIVCNGKEQLEMPAGSILGINATCSGTALILSHGIAGRGSLFDAVRACRRTRSRW
jgi:hypothetical protein